MPNNPKLTGERLAAVLSAWKTLRKTKSFAGMTLDEFTAKVQPSLDARALLDTLDNQVTAGLDERDIADVETNKQLLLVVNAVKGDPAEGEDGELYDAMGYVRKSERASGLTQKTKPKPATP